MTHGATPSICEWFRGDPERPHPRRDEPTPWPGWVQIQVLQAQRDATDRELEERRLSTIWVYLVDFSDWWQVVIPHDGVLLGSIAQWVLMQGPVAIAEYQLGELAFTWFRDMAEEVELPLK